MPGGGTAVPIVRRTLTGAALMLVTFAMLMAGSALIRQATFSTPLSRTMQALGIMHYRIGPATQNGSASVMVRLPNGIDLQSTVEGVESRLAPILGHAPTVTVSGPGQVRLRDAVQALGIPAQQAAATGAFVAMSRLVRADARAYHVHADLQVGNAAVYLTVIGPGREGDAYLVIPRTGTLAQASSTTAGVTS